MLPITHRRNPTILPLSLFEAALTAPRAAVATLNFRVQRPDAQQLMIEVDLPGVAAEQVTVEQEDRHLVIALNTEEGARFAKGQYRIAIDKGWDLDRTQAQLRHGWLTITLPAQEPLRKTIPLLAA